jgi:hypothetical protein
MGPIGDLGFFFAVSVALNSQQAPFAVETFP